MVLTVLRNRSRPNAARRLYAMLAVAALSTLGFANSYDIRATVDGDLVNFPDVQPMMSNGRVLVPVRGVFEHMNANVDWDADTQTVSAQRGNDNIRLQINSHNATVNGRDVNLDSPATFYRGRTMVPLRFLSESLGAQVQWIENTRTVEINSQDAPRQQPPLPRWTSVHLASGTVIPFRLEQRLSSNRSRQGDSFSATLDSDRGSNYQGIPRGATLQGHVAIAQAKHGQTPGVLGLVFDSVTMPDRKSYAIHGSLIGLDSDSVTNRGDRMEANPGADDNLKWVGYGAGGGALLGILTKGNVITDAAIGGALGFMFNQSQRDNSNVRDVVCESGTQFGVRLTRYFEFRMPTPNRR